jgi:hypothetical protein
MEWSSWGTALQAGRSRVRFPMGVTGIFHWLNLSGRTISRGVDSVSNKNEYQGYLLGGKGGRCVGLTTLQPSHPERLEILEASASWSPKGLCRPVMGDLASSSSSSSSSVWGRRLPTECNAAYLGLLYKPRFCFPPFHLQARSTSDDARELCQRKVEVWARNVQSI